MNPVRFYRHLTFILWSLGSVLAAQTPGPVTALVPPAGLTYRFWPLSLTQFVGPELPYDAISIYVDDRGPSPAYDVAFTARDTHERTHYVNKPELAAEDKLIGEKATVVRIAFDKTGDVGKGTQYSVRFNTPEGIPVQWQVEQLTEVSNQGSGLTQLKTLTPYLLYREQGALAGPATALKVGSVTSNAMVWKELSAPPYFVPYQGAVSQGVHIISLHNIDNLWKSEQPATLMEGSKWTMTSNNGQQLLARSTASGTVITFTDPVQRTEMTVEAQVGQAGWTIAKINLSPATAKPDHTMHLTFTPALSAGKDSRFDMTLGKNTKVANGDGKSFGAESKQSLKWTLNAPSWAANETATATATVQ